MNFYSKHSNHNFNSQLQEIRGRTDLRHWVDQEFLDAELSAFDFDRILIFLTEEEPRKSIVFYLEE